MSTEADANDRLSVSVRKPEGTLEQQRSRRAEALKKIEGMWKDRADIPKDGVEYQNQIRSEWP